MSDLKIIGLVLAIIAGSLGAYYGGIMGLLAVILGEISLAITASDNGKE